MMDVYQAATTRRTVRRFQQKAIPASLLERIVDAGRLAPSAANRQKLRFIVVEQADNREALFKHLAWGGYVVPRRVPAEGQRPMAYVVGVICDNEVSGVLSDGGAAMQTMILTAWSEGVASCWIASVDRPAVAKLLDVPEEFRVYDVLALGYPAEKPVPEVVENDAIKYWLDENDVLHVPKRRLSEVVYHEKFAR